jgi:acyl-CoA synthetase (NDP forming)
MAGSRKVWQSIVRQTGAIPVVGFEQLLDSLMGFSMLTEDLGHRIAILSGPGGLAVGAAEAVGAAGLKLADISQETKSKLAEFVAPTGTSLSNPVDVGLTASLEMDIYVQAARALASDPGVDAVVVVGAGLTQESNQLYTDAMIQARNDFGKPFLIVSIPGFDKRFADSFCQAGVPFFETAERAMAVYESVRHYQTWRKLLSS